MECGQSTIVEHTLFSVLVAHARSLSTGSPNSSINRDWQSANKFSVRNLHIILIDHRILHGSVDFSVSQELLNLLDGHTFVYRTCCQRPSELMRMNFRNSQPPAKLAQTHLNTADFQSIVGTMQRNKHGGLFFGSAIQIISEVDFRPGIKVNGPLLTAFAKNYALSVLKINIVPIQMHQFTNTHSGRCQ